MFITKGAQLSVKVGPQLAQNSLGRWTNVDRVIAPSAACITALGLGVSVFSLYQMDVERRRLFSLDEGLFHLRTSAFYCPATNMSKVMELEDFRIHYLATVIQKTWKGWRVRKKYRNMKSCQRIIASNYRKWKTRNYLTWLSRHLPCESPICQDWPSAPRSLYRVNHLLKKLFHRWRCHKYRLKYDQTSRNRMREKATASGLFLGRKESYAKTVAHPFCGDYIRLRSNSKWKKLAAETGDQYVVFADIVNKINRSSGECVQKLLVLSTCSMLILDHRTLQIKYRICVKDIFRLSISPFTDDIVVIHVLTSETCKRKGAFVFESGHVIEIVTKLFLVIQNATSKPPEVQIVPKFYANFGREIVMVLFKKGDASGQAGQAASAGLSSCLSSSVLQGSTATASGSTSSVPSSVKINRKSGKLEVTL